MAEIRFHYDEHMPNAVARALRRLGIGVETTSDAGLMGAPDPVHLAHAHAHGPVTVTEDDDYRRLHDSGQGHSGIVFFPGRPCPIGELVESLTLVHASYTAEEMSAASNGSDRGHGRRGLLGYERERKTRPVGAFG